MKSSLKHLAIILLSFLSFYPASGMYFSLLGSKKYYHVGDQVDAAEIAKLLGKSRLSKNKQIRLAFYCEKFPSACTKKLIFTKMDPNLKFENGDSVLRSYVKLLQNGMSEFAPLIEEAFNNQALNPHLISSVQEDLALDILRNSDYKLTQILLAHRHFNPNQCYGSLNEPLASLLIKSKNYNALDFVLAHKSFDNKVADASGIRPGFYLLMDYSQQKNRFFAFMGTQLATWNLIGLGLYEHRQLNILLQDIFKIKEDRLLIFKKYVEQIVLWNEVNPLEHANGMQVLVSLLGLDALGSKVYIDNDFMQQALTMLVDYGLIQNNIENDIHPSRFWSKDSILDLSETNIPSIRKAFKCHYTGSHEKICTICLEENEGAWFKSSRSCEHAICSKCWLELLVSHTYEEDLVCPARNCGVIVPPSLYLALNVKVLDDDVAYESLLKAYRAQLCYYQRKHQKFLEGVPNLRTCTQCKANFMFDIKLAKPRKLLCPQCKTLHVVTDDAKNELSPITLDGIWGYCNECKTVIDKRSGCDGIYCLICKKGTTFIPL